MSPWIGRGLVNRCPKGIVAMKTVVNSWEITNSAVIQKQMNPKYCNNAKRMAGVDLQTGFGDLSSFWRKEPG